MSWFTGMFKLGRAGRSAAAAARPGPARRSSESVTVTVSLQVTCPGPVTFKFIIE
jgi:hypothetical protein